MSTPTRLSVPAGYINTAALARLANPEVNALAANYGSLSPDLQASMSRLAAERTQEINDAAATVILDLKGMKNDFLVARAQAIEALKAQIADNEKLMAAAQTADQYGDATSNFLPLAKMMGQGVAVDVKKELLSVPKDWAPTPAAAPAAAA